MRHFAFPLTLSLFAAVASSFVACTDEETPFNEIDRLRVLGIRASKPWLLEGEMATLDFLAVNNDPDLQDEPLEIRWHFCPVQADSTVGFGCFIQSLADLQTLTGTAALPPIFNEDDFSEFGLLIGTSSTAVLPFILPAESIAQACAALDSTELPPFVTRPECNGRFPVTVFLEYGPRRSNNPDDTSLDPDRRVVSFRDISLIYDLQQELNPPNINPEINGLSVGRRGEDIFVPTSTGSPTILRFDTGYNFRADVNLDQSERFIPDDDDEPDRESLFITWFIEGGSTEFVRTGYLPEDDGEDISGLLDNEWTTPKRADLGDRRDLQLFLVIRDSRGGLSWLVRDIHLNDATGL